MSVATATRREILHQQMQQRLTLARLGRAVTTGVLLVVTLVYVVAPLQAVSWLRHPYLGALVEYPLNISVPETTGETGRWPGVAAGLRNGDEIIMVNNQMMDSVRALNALLTESEAGERALVMVAHDDGTMENLTIPLVRMPLSDVFTLFVVPYLVGLIWLVVGLWVYRRRRDQAVGRTFALFCAAVALILGTTFDLWTSQLFARLWTAGFSLAGGGAMALALLFPAESRLVARHPMRQWWPYVPALVMLVYAQVMLTAAHPAMLQAWLAQYYWAALGGLLFVAAQIYRALFTPSPIAREQSRIVLIGAALSFTPFSIWATNVGAFSVEWVIVAMVFFPIAITYSIIYYRLPDTERLLSFGLTYSAMAIIVAIGYALLVYGASLILGSAVSANHPVAIALLTFAAVLAFQPLRQQLQRSIDTLFFRSRGILEQRATEFRHDLAVTSSLTSVISILKRYLSETIGSAHVYIFLRDPHTSEFVSIGEEGRPDTDMRFAVSSGLAHALSTTREVIFLSPDRPLPPELIEEHAALAVLQTPVLAALRSQERLMGWMAVGPKRSGESFSMYDLRFVQTLGELVSLAIERARATSDLERRVRELDVLSHVSQAVNFTVDLDTLMEMIYTQTGKLIDTTNFYIVLRDSQEEDELIYAFFLEGGERLTARENTPWPGDLGLESEVLRTGRPIRTDDYVSECAFRGVAPHSMEYRAWMGAPLNAGGGTLGALIVASYAYGVTFTDEQLKVFWAIADQAATAIDKARLFRETQLRNRQMTTLYEISRELSTLALEPLLERIMRSAIDILEAEAGSLLLVNDAGFLEFRVVVGGGGGDLVGVKLEPGTGIVGQVANTGEPIIINDVRADKRWFGGVAEDTGFETRALITVPLNIHDRVIGVLQLINKRDGSAFSDDDITMLMTFASQAAVAIENARLFETTDAELRDRVDELSILQRIDRDLNRAFDVERVIQITLDWAKWKTHASAGAIAMLTPEGDHMTLLASFGYEDEYSKINDEPVLIPANTGIVGRILRTGQPEIVAEVHEDPDYISAATADSVSQMTVPILRANRAIGVLVLESSVAGLFDRQDLGFISRLTEHATVAIDNARLFQEVRAANEAKTEFIRFVSHELKTPMTSIRGYTDLLMSGQVGDVNEMQVQFLTTIRSNVERMNRLVTDLTDVARIEAGVLRIDLAPIPFRSVLDETLRSTQGQIDERKQTLTVDVPDDLPLINADHTRMVQVLMNLVSNAYKYTPEGGEIRIGAKPMMSQPEKEDEAPRKVVHVWVTDTGIGISEEDQKALFGKFFRTEAGKNMATGTGLGLNITKNLVELHGGTIWVESEVGKGTTFHYTVPVVVEGA
jgi:signal transduction histidine kinase